MTELIMRVLTARDDTNGGVTSPKVAQEIGITLEAWAKATRLESRPSGGAGAGAEPRPMVFVFYRGAEVVLISYDERALEQLLAKAVPELLAKKGLTVPALANTEQWRPYDVVGRMTYEGDDWCKLAFRAAGDTDPKRYLGMDGAGFSYCGCERSDLDRVFPGLYALHCAWYDTTKHRSMKGYWLEF